MTLSLLCSKVLKLSKSPHSQSKHARKGGREGGREAILPSSGLLKTRWDSRIDLSRAGMLEWAAEDGWAGGGVL